MKIPEHKIQFTVEGFNETFEYYMSCSISQIEAYYKTEKMHETVCGAQRYRSHKSFTTSRAHYLKKKK